MVLRPLPAALVVLVILPTGCGGEPSGGEPRGSTSNAPVAARPASSIASAGEPCGIGVSRSCAGGLTCVRPPEGDPTCQALPRGIVCGVFQCGPDEACCDPSRSECTKPGAECAPRPPDPR